MAKTKGRIQRRRKKAQSARDGKISLWQLSEKGIDQKIEKKSYIIYYLLLYSFIYSFIHPFILNPNWENQVGCMAEIPECLLA